MPKRIAFAISLVLLGLPAFVQAQAVRPLPYNSQLRTDPVVGNIQGVQRYGRALRTDPDEGEGYSYHVYPVAYEPLRTAIVASAQAQGASPATSRKLVIDYLKGQRKTLEDEVKASKKDLQPLLDKTDDALKALDELQKEETAKSRVPEAGVEESKALGGATGGSYAPLAPVGYGDYPTLYPPPFDATAGIRNWDLQPSLIYQTVPGPDGVQSKAIAVHRPSAGEATTIQIYHQPLIQIKMRVIEVGRGDEFAAASVLDYISHVGKGPRLFSDAKAKNINLNRERTAGATRFGLPPLGINDTLIGLTGTGTTNDFSLIGGTGLLVNLTGEHINYIASLLATEFNADLITAPEVVTLNGQNVEFVAGSKLPFQIGQNVITGSGQNIQQFFYKHVGTFVSVTPRIVNWGLHAEGGGEAPIVAADVWKWDRLLEWMLKKQKTGQVWLYPKLNVGTKDTPKLVDHPVINATTIGNYFASGELPVPVEVKGWVLDQLKGYSKSALIEMLLKENLTDVICPPSGPQHCDCNWRPEDCTIDLSVVVRISDSGTKTINLGTKDGAVTTEATTENNVRGVSNVIQLKSGHGVVMAGLIGERELEEVRKVPVIGDAPVLGFLFRSKAVERQKTELLVFIEAKVLDPCPDVARAQSANDFTLGHPYVAGEFLENPLEYGLYRAGFGAYLPPHSKSEQIFWERLGRKIRRACTHIDDAIE